MSSLQGRPLQRSPEADWRVFGQNSSSLIRPRAGTRSKAHSPFPAAPREPNDRRASAWVFSAGMPTLPAAGRNNCLQRGAIAGLVNAALTRHRYKRAQIPISILRDPMGGLRDRDCNPQEKPARIGRPSRQRHQGPVAAGIDRALCRARDPHGGGKAAICRVGAASHRRRRRDDPHGRRRRAARAPHRPDRNFPAAVAERCAERHSCDASRRSRPGGRRSARTPSGRLSL